MEFSEAERATLLEVNTELELQITGLESSLREKQAMLEAQEESLRSAE